MTGANGHLGRRLVTSFAGRGASVHAAVRSESAARTLAELPEGTCRTHIVRYTDPDEIAQAAEGCRGIVHLVGILKESKRSRYLDAHERATEAIVAAAAKAGVERVVTLSILGASPASSNACLASKGRSEEILLAGSTDCLVIRLPMVLGPGDVASRALRGQARARLLPLVGGGRSLEQPIDALDVAEAVWNALGIAGLGRSAIDLAGPESLSHRALVMRAARLWGRPPFVLPVPMALARAAARLAERGDDPPITLPMLEVLQHDDQIDPTPACDRLGLRLTPLNETLRRCVGPEAPE